MNIRKEIFKMKKIILVVLTMLLFTGCAKTISAYERYQQETDWKAWEGFVEKKHEELETLLFENIEIETYESNTNYWD
jgi:PBP1b-binding outer membrane lipoprotein LpoB